LVKPSLFAPSCIAVLVPLMVLITAIRQSRRSKNNMVGATGFEPAASWSRTMRAAKLRYAPTPEIITPIWAEVQTITLQHCHRLRL
jgi:hypothetical protein